MTGPDTAAAFLLRQIGRAKSLRAARQQSSARAGERLMLRKWQVARLAHTHRDLLEDPDYRPAAEFFLSELYGVKDTTKRDAEVERAFPLMVKTLPERALHGLGAALELDALTEQLDDQLIEALLQQTGTLADITESAYADAYRRCDNYALRQHQIDLISEVGSHLAEVVSKPVLAKGLRAMRIPARLAGFGELQGFLERGFEAFRQVRDPRKFLTRIERRERQILDRIYAAQPHPFEIEPSVNS